MLAIIILVAGILNLIMGLIIILGSKRKQGSVSFALFSFTTFIWALFNFLMYKTNYPIFVRLSYSAGSFLIASLLMWVFDFSSDVVKNKINWKYIIIYLYGLIFAVVPFINNLIVFNIQKNNAGGFSAEEGLLMPLYISFILIGYFIVLLKLIKFFRSSNGDDRKQVKVILTGFGIYGGLNVLFGLILPFLGYDKLIDFDVPSSLIFITFTTYAIVQYKWMNIKVITFELLAIFIVGVSLTEIFIADTTGQRIYKIIMFLILSTLSIFMVKSVLNEVKRKDELQEMSDKLSSANDQLRKLDMAKSDFISIASHQLRSPLTAIKGFISLIKEGSYGPVGTKVMDALGKVYLSNEHLIQLVEDLLSISRIESGRMEYTFAPVQIEDMLREAGDTYAVPAKNRGLYLEMKLPEKPLPKVEIDAEKIRQVINNTIDNSLKYTEKGGVTVRAELADSQQSKVQGISSRSIEEPLTVNQEPSIRITVSDTGIGIPAEEMPYIFSKFSRGKDQNRLHATGTGLGLYVGKQLVEAHRGKIWVESDGQGRGSRFIFELPLSQKKFEEEKKVKEFVKSI